MNYICIPGLKNKVPFETVYRNAKYVIEPQKIINIISEHYETKPESLKTKSRADRRVKVRQMIYYFLRRYTHLSLKDIGEMFDRDHTTIIHGLQSLQNLRWAYPDLEIEILKIDNKL